MYLWSLILILSQMVYCHEMDNSNRDPIDSIISSSSSSSTSPLIPSTIDSHHPDEVNHYYDSNDVHHVYHVYVPIKRYRRPPPLPLPLPPSSSRPLTSSYYYSSMVEKEPIYWPRMAYYPSRVSHYRPRYRPIYVPHYKTTVLPSYYSPPSSTIEGPYSYPGFDSIHGISGRLMDTPFGMPVPGAHSNVNFDRQTTIDELRSKQINPTPFIINPALQRGIANLQRLEAAYHQNPVALKMLLKPFLMMTNPQK